MNDRIESLIELAEVWNTDGDVDKCEVDLHKFAELIVAECVDICYNHPARIPSNNWQGVTVPLNIAQRLKEHFGVEE